MKGCQVYRSITQFNNAARGTQKVEKDAETRILALNPRRSLRGCWLGWCLGQRGDPEGMVCHRGQDSAPYRLEHWLWLGLFQFGCSV